MNMSLLRQVNCPPIDRPASCGPLMYLLLTDILGFETALGPALAGGCHTSGSLSGCPRSIICRCNTEEERKGFGQVTRHPSTLLQVLSAGICYCISCSWHHAAYLAYRHTGCTVMRHSTILLAHSVSAACRCKPAKPATMHAHIACCSPVAIINWSWVPEWVIQLHAKATVQLMLQWAVAALLCLKMTGGHVGLLEGSASNTYGESLQKA